VFFGEPPRSQGDLHFSVFGIPVRVHPWFWIVGVLLTSGELLDREATPDLMAALQVLLPWMAAFFLSILIHELGHALVMRFYGFSPWITLYGFGGLASYSPAARYGSRGLGTFGQVLISAAGPGAGFVLAGVVMGLLLLSGHHVPTYWLPDFLPWGGPTQIIGSLPFTRFIGDVLQISIFWGVVNLLPVYPLDGGNIAREILLTLNPRDGIRQSLILSIVAGAAVAALSLVTLKSWWMALLFGYLAYASYQALQSYSGRW